MKAVNSTVVEDEQMLVGETVRDEVAGVEGEVPVLAPVGEGGSVRALLGRGPGEPGAGVMGGGGS